MLYAPRNDHDVALAADPLFAAEGELHLSLEHPNDLLIGVTVRLDMDTGPDTPPYDHPLLAGEDAAADLFTELLLGQGGKRTEARLFRHSFLPNQQQRFFASKLGCWRFAVRICPGGPARHRQRKEVVSCCGSSSRYPKTSRETPMRYEPKSTAA